MTKTLLVLGFLLTSITNTSATEFFHLKTNLGKKLGATQLQMKDLGFNSSGNPVPITVILFIARNPGQQLSEIVKASSVFRNLVAYTRSTTGSSTFIEEAPMYGNVVAVLRNQTQVAAARKVFSNKSPTETFTVEIFEGIRDTFESSPSFENGQYVYRAEQCETHISNPLWTLRFIDSSTMIDSETKDASRLFPSSKTVKSSGINNCLNILNTARTSSALLN